MTVYCNVTMSGADIGKKAQAFGKAVEKVATGTYCKKHQNLLNANFKRYLRSNIQRAGIPEELEDAFFIKIIGNRIIFGNDNGMMTNRYEYGWEDDVDDDDYISSEISMSPRYYIRPAISQTTIDLTELLKEDVYKEYTQKAGNLYSEHEWKTDIPQKHRYMNKYNGVL